jgi:hypothetical protein
VAQPLEDPPRQPAFISAMTPTKVQAGEQATIELRVDVDVAAVAVIPGSVKVELLDPSRERFRVTRCPQ